MDQQRERTLFHRHFLRTATQGDPYHLIERAFSLTSFDRTRETSRAQIRPDFGLRIGVRPPDRGPLRGITVTPDFVRNCFIVSLMFWAALSYQSNHRDFGPHKVVALVAVR